MSNLKVGYGEERGWLCHSWEGESQCAGGVAHLGGCSAGKLCKRGGGHFLCLSDI